MQQRQSHKFSSWHRQHVKNETRFRGGAHTHYRDDRTIESIARTSSKKKAKPNLLKKMQQAGRQAGRLVHTPSTRDQRRSAIGDQQTLASNEQPAAWYWRQTNKLS